MKKWTKTGRVFISSDKTQLACLAWDVSFYPSMAPSKTSKRTKRFPADLDINLQVSKDFYAYSCNPTIAKGVINNIRRELDKYEDAIEAGRAAKEASDAEG